MSIRLILQFIIKAVLKLKNLFGRLKEWKKPTAEIMEEADKELGSGFLERQYGHKKLFYTFKIGSLL